jgi:hypothetical protein
MLQIRSLQSHDTTIVKTDMMTTTIGKSAACAAAIAVMHAAAAHIAQIARMPQ